MNTENADQKKMLFSYICVHPCLSMSDHKEKWDADERGKRGSEENAFSYIRVNSCLSVSDH